MPNLGRRLLLMPLQGLIEAITPDRYRMRRDGNSIVPPKSIAGRSLFAVITIMSFLASFTTGVAYMVLESANAWFADIASEVTVQVAPVRGQSMEQRLSQITLFLARQKGLATVRPLSKTDSSQLLEPWLGENIKALDALPIPRLIAVEINRADPPDMAAIKQALESAFPGTLLDDHRRWQTQIKTVIGSMALGAAFILLLVAIATIAIVMSAARSAMLSNRDIIEVLDLVGANHGFIVHEFARHFLVLGIRAGFLGAAAAAVLFIMLPTMMQLFSSASMTSTELKRLIGPAALDFTGYLLIGGVVIAQAAICTLTSQYWVNHVLNYQARQTRKTNSHGGLFGSLSRSIRTAERAKPPVGAQDRGTMFHFTLSGMIKGLAKFIFWSSLPLAAGFVLFVIAMRQDAPANVERADGIVVLTGADNRIAGAIRLLAKGKARRLLISGVHPSTTPRQLKRLVPGNDRLFDCCIDIDHKALNTIGNAEQTARWARQKGFRTIIVVTSGYHMLRSRLEIKRVLPEAGLIPYPIHSPRFTKPGWWSEPAALKLLALEYLKLLRAGVRLAVSRVIQLAN